MRKGECGIYAYAEATGSTPQKIRSMFQRRFGTECIRGPQMRQLMTEQRWSWISSYAMPRCDLPSTGRALVVTRRGFYTRVDGVDRNGFDATICGYYTKG